MFWQNADKEALRKAGERLERLQAEINRLSTEKSTAAAIVNSMIEGVIAVDRDSRILSLNPTVEKIFGVSQSAVGRLFLEAIPNNGLYEVIVTVLQQGAPLSQELTLVWPVRKIFQVNASAIFTAQSVAGCLLVIHDITEVRKLETVRSDFIANVSHELKTPLTSIKGFVETLLEGAIDDKENRREFLAIIRDHADRLNSLVNDLLELSHLESRQIELEYSPVNPAASAAEVLSGFKSQLKKKSISVENQIADITLPADKERICQVLTNLFDNAIKYTKEKTTVKIYSEIIGSTVMVSVKDEGPGIPAKDIPRLFERFYRVDKARSREMGGTGLGLSIVKHIVELHGGAVGVESVEGLGSRFWFTLPLELPGKILH